MYHIIHKNNNIQEQIINKITKLNDQSSHYEHIMETIRNMTQNQTQTNLDTQKQILDKLGLEDIPDIDELLVETNTE